MSDSIAAAGWAVLETAGVGGRPSRRFAVTNAELSGGLTKAISPALPGASSCQLPLHASVTSAAVGNFWPGLSISGPARARVRATLDGGVVAGQHHRFHLSVAVRNRSRRFVLGAFGEVAFAEPPRPHRPMPTTIGSTVFRVRLDDKQARAQARSVRAAGAQPCLRGAAAARSQRAIVIGELGQRAFADVEQARAAARPFRGRINDRMRWGPAERPATLVPVAEPPGTDPPGRL